MVYASRGGGSKPLFLANLKQSKPSQRQPGLFVQRLYHSKHFVEPLLTVILVYAVNMTCMLFIETSVLFYSIILLLMYKNCKCLPTMIKFTIS